MTQSESTPNPTVPVEDRVANEDIKTVPADSLPVPSAVDSKVVEQAEADTENIQQGAAPGRVPTEPEVPSEVEDAKTDEAEAVNEPSPEDASDAQLVEWAKANGFDDMPTSRKLRPLWRERVTAAMAAALDPKEEGSVEPPSSSEGTLKAGDSTDQENSGSTEEETPEPEPYRSVWQAPETWVSSQAFTA